MTKTEVFGQIKGRRIAENYIGEVDHAEIESEVYPSDE